MSATQSNEGRKTREGDDDDDIVLEREKSAWDVLEERFQQGAANGCYLDLSGEDGSVRELGVADAEEALAAVEPVDPSAIVPTAEESSTQEAENQQNPLLIELGSIINELVSELKSTRERLLSGTSQKDQILYINRLSKQLQKFVNRNADAVMDSGVAVRRIENMNLLIYKANALIITFNKSKAGSRENISQFKNNISNRGTRASKRAAAQKAKRTVKKEARGSKTRRKTVPLQTL